MKPLLIEWTHYVHAMWRVNRMKVKYSDLRGEIVRLEKESTELSMKANAKNDKAKSRWERAIQRKCGDSALASASYFWSRHKNRMGAIVNGVIYD